MTIQEVKQKISLCNNSLTVPEMRKIAKEIAKEDYQDFLDNNPLDDFHLRMIHTFVIGYAKDEIQILLQYFENFVPYVNHWAVCDSLCQNFRITRQYPQETWNMLMKYRNSRKEFESRIVSVALLSHYLTEEYLGSVFEVLSGLCAEEYYARMGTAWAIAEIMAKFPDQCTEYLLEHHLDVRTHNKALQKIRESNKIPAEIKQMTYTWKR